MADNEDATASLGDSEEARVEHSPRAHVPEVIQRAEEDGEVSSLMDGKKAGDVFEQQPSRTTCSRQIEESEDERAPCASEAGASAGDGEVLAGEPSHPEVGNRDI